mgnify:CR=1 FL=1
MADRRHLGRRAALFLAAAVVATIGLAAVPDPANAWAPGQFEPNAEAELFALTNDARAAAGLPVLKNDLALKKFARYRSKDMGDRDYFSHNIPPTGKMVFAVMTAGGYCYKWAGENIGWSTYPDETATAQIQQMFMASATHRANILNGRWTNMGIGAYQAADGKKLWTVLFSVPCGTSASISSPPRPKMNGSPPFRRTT